MLRREHVDFDVALAECVTGAEDGEIDQLEPLIDKKLGHSPHGIGSCAGIGKRVAIRTCSRESSARLKGMELDHTSADQHPACLALGEVQQRMP